MSKIEIGKIVNTHGLRGTLKVQPWVDFPEIFEKIDVMYISDQKYSVKKVSYQKNLILLDLEEINSISQAEKLKDLIIFAERDDLGKLSEDSYYIADLIGCDVMLSDGGILGTVRDVITSSGTDLYEIKRKNDKPLYLPAAKEFIKSIDIESKTIHAVLPEGLLGL